MQEAQLKLRWCPWMMGSPMPCVQNGFLKYRVRFAMVSDVEMVSDVRKVSDVNCNDNTQFFLTYFSIVLD